jgi:hypothetical protein
LIFAALFDKIKYRDPAVMPAWNALRMANIEGAQAIGVSLVRRQPSASRSRYMVRRNELPLISES